MYYLYSIYNVPVCTRTNFPKHITKCIMKNKHIISFDLEIIINFPKVLLLYEVLRITKSKEIVTSMIERAKHWGELGNDMCKFHIF